MRRRLTWILALLLAAAALGWALRPRPVAVDLAVVGRADVEVVVEETGRTRIREVFTVSAPGAGRMERLVVHPGDAVAAGEVVARLGPVPPALLDVRARRMAEAARNAATAAVDLAQAELARAAAQADFAQAEMARAGALLERGAIPARAMEQARLDEAAARAGRASAEANLLVARRQLESAEAALIEAAAEAGGDCCLEARAPAAGRVLRVLTESEQVVAAGTPLLEIGDPADLEVVVGLLSSDAVRVRVGAAAEVTGWGGPPLAAHVARLDPSAVTRVSALGIEEQRVTAVLALDAPPARREGLLDGYGATVRIAVWSARDVPALPLGALFRDGDDWAVFRVDGGRARTVPVAIGERDARHAVLRGGVAAGDAVVLHPGDRVADGVRVAARRGG